MDSLAGSLADMVEHFSAMVSTKKSNRGHNIYGFDDLPMVEDLKDLAYYATRLAEEIEAQQSGGES